ncbi:hypothetical protein [Burkholderia cepacia]|uniref:hypothetical protein n=1 Tax=Burkholderia cepacia TaxID=292 RepID=UPI002FDF34D1
MTAQNENSPLTRSASGQENGTEIEARGLSSADSGMPAENLSQEKSPAPEQASEAADQRPSTENATAESIVDARAAGGNGTSSKVGRADALIDVHEAWSRHVGSCNENRSDIQREKRSFVCGWEAAERNVMRKLAASPVEQPAAAPNDSGTVSVACFSGSYPHGTITYSQLAPSPADERAAFPRYAEWLHLRTHGEWSSGVPEWARDHSGHMNDFTAARAVIEELARGRAASANEAGADGATVAWMRADDPRDCISDAKKRDMIEHAGAPGARLAENCSIALGVTAPAQAAVPAIYQIRTEEGAWLDVPHRTYEKSKNDPALTRVVYTIPKPLSRR